MKQVYEQYLHNLNTLKGKAEDEMFDEIAGLTDMTFGSSHAGGYLCRALEEYSEHVGGLELLEDMMDLTTRLLANTMEDSEGLLDAPVYSEAGRDQFVHERLKETGLTIEQIKAVLAAEYEYGVSIGIYPSIPA